MCLGPGQPEVSLWHAERPCTCTCLCFNRPKMTINEATGMVLGSVVDPWACCDLTFKILDPQVQQVLVTIVYFLGRTCSKSNWWLLSMGTVLLAPVWTLQNGGVRHQGPFLWTGSW
eukprot:GHVL01029856.1.p1 GENE.GHVL01029856.1~~GHVL01029856.1.p1  ORF type:complete len:116 (-),score=5.51 GHVL01029856.1:353-700(-)